jgi:formylglycine-generating enzyme required for sulfatase activity
LRSRRWLQTFAKRRQLGRGNRAVGDINVADVDEYLNWLSKKSEKRYRLLTEAEWEYIARAGTKTAYPWGEEFGTGNAVCLTCKVGSVMSIEVAKVPPNKFGLYDTIGSRYEWVQDCWNNNYDGAPTDGSEWIEGDCTRHVVRGGSWYESAKFLRSASRFRAVVQ